MRNACQNYNLAVNLSDRVLYTYMGVLQPRLRNANYCTAGAALCPTKALYVVDRGSMTVAFDRERGIACEKCLKVCPYEAMEILFD
jgi:Fe-S-cluster-containing hydrogenase component 2